MSVIPNCHNCGAPLSKTSLQAFVPSCDNCGTPIMGVGGTLGMTSAFEREDPALKKEILKKQLEVYFDHHRKYQGMIGVCKQQLDWQPERYAKLPSPPELLPLKTVPPFFTGLMWSIFAAIVWFVCALIVGVVVSMIFAVGSGIHEAITTSSGSQEASEDHTVAQVYTIIFCYLGPLICLCSGPYLHFKVVRENGQAPQENEHRKEHHKQATMLALKEAEPIKNTEDHKLRRQIVELEGKMKLTWRKIEETRSQIECVS